MVYFAVCNIVYTVYKNVHIQKNCYNFKCFIGEITVKCYVHIFTFISTPINQILKT